MRKAIVKVFTGCILLGGWAGADEVRSPVRDYVGVYETRLEEGSELKVGDVVQVVRQGEPVGEAVMVRYEDRMRLQTRGALECRWGDQILFLRETQQPVAAAPRVIRESFVARETRSVRGSSASARSSPNATPYKSNADEYFNTHQSGRVFDLGSGKYQAGAGENRVYVNPYQRQDGTTVGRHTRSYPVSRP